MTSPPPPPGWHPDPAGTGRQRWWDGTNWTEFYADSYPYPAPQYSAPPQYTTPIPAPTSAANAVPKDEDVVEEPGGGTSDLSNLAELPSPEKRILSRGNKIALGIGAAVVVLILISAIAGTAGDDEDKSTISTTSTTTATTFAPITTTVAAAPVTTTGTAAAPRTKTTTTKPLGCQEAPPEYLDVINASFLHGYQLTDVSAFSVGEIWYIAGEITVDGKVRSRDDLFAAQDLFITPVTATARIESTLPDLRKVLDVDFLDTGAQTALDCARTY